MWGVWISGNRNPLLTSIISLTDFQLTSIKQLTQDSHSNSQENVLWIFHINGNNGTWLWKKKSKQVEDEKTWELWKIFS